jgi:hypothetical protein
MGKESMGEFLESAVASVLRFKHNWQTVTENYHLLRPPSIKKKHEPKVSSIEIDVFAFGCSHLPRQSSILAPRYKNEILLVQCKDHWYEHEHKGAVAFLNKAEKIVALHYPSSKSLVRKVVVTLLLSPKALVNKYLDNSKIQIICNVSHLRRRTQGMRNSKQIQELLDDYLRRRIIGDLREEIVRPLLAKIYEHLRKQNQLSLTNFPSLAMQSLRFFVNLNHFSDESKYFPFIADKFCRTP